jgi:Transglutaminase-like superfamily
VNASGGALLSLISKGVIFLKIWFWFVAVHARLRMHPLPEAVQSLRPRVGGARYPISPRGLGKVIVRVLTVGGHTPRCLINALVHYRLLAEQGLPAVLVIGLEADARDHKAHAWVELDGVDVGPPPGQAGHVPLARYH